VLSPFHLARLRLTQQEYTARAQTQAEARAAYVAAMADPTLPNTAKHNVEASYHVTYGRAYFKCRGCACPRYDCRLHHPALTCARRHVGSGAVCVLRTGAPGR
jgi:hypothetical protein